ncbi:MULTISPECIES: LrgB family protein [Psychrobacter]|uniref:LrgA-associated membrane protein LrgB n=1 Tax=Psychrobacter alimentarius TaxID=261164 RepID=A0ABN4N1I9_9GAMM|nr:MULTISPECIES: LrgB family protein [Psychrobacter]AMT96080.1 LrgA-associated membrane protein LrgB [Psychrobacter alimentarius]QCB31508.1 LrgB family protein [Psychrobacter sp. PAMC27889]
MITDNVLLTTLAAILLTLAAHVIARVLARKLSWLPMVITALVLVLVFLFLLQWDYNHYYSAAKPVFDHLLGYVTVLLAVPLAAMNFKGLPIKKLTLIVVLASVIGALLPMSLAYLMSLSHDTILAFATRSVTTPIGLSVADLIRAPLPMANLIIIVSGLLGGTLARFLFRGIDDDRAKGLALGLAAHAFGTVEAWQISHTAGRYAAFGLAVNGLVTAVWVPIFIGALSG